MRMFLSERLVHSWLALISRDRPPTLLRAGAQHDYDRLNFIPSADYLIVEGTSQGRMSGKSWAGGKTPGGSFCNVFKFRDGRISSLRIYLDPDYAGEDEARFRWSKNRQR